MALAPEELLVILDPRHELAEDYALGLCTARLRIFRSFLRYVRRAVTDDAVGSGPRGAEAERHAVVARATSHGMP